MAQTLTANPTVSLRFPRFTRLARTLRAWRTHRQEQAEMARFTPRDLHDIGWTSTDRIGFLSRPFWRR